MSIEPDVASQTMGATSYEPMAESPQVAGQMSGAAPSGDRPVQSSTMLGKLYDLWDVDTSDVIERCLLALNPLLSVPFLTNGMVDSEHASKPGSIAHGKNPDMWGPVWIYLTMVFAVFFSATTSGLLNNVHGDYDAGLLTGIAGTLFAFTFVVPVVVWFCVQFFNLVPTLTLVQTVCLYGYSFTIWIPAVVVVGSPLGARALVGTIIASLVRYITIGIAFALSAVFVYGNLYKVMSAQASQAVSVDKSKMACLLVAGILVHAGLAVTIAVLSSIASKELTQA